MKKFRLIILFIAAFFISLGVVKANCVTSQREFNDTYKAKPAGLQLVAETKQMTDFADLLTDNASGKNTVTIQVYYEQVEKVLYFYKKVIGKEDYTLLACMGKLKDRDEVHTRTYCKITDTTADTCEQFSAAPVKDELTCSVDPIADQPGKVTQQEANAIYDEVINHKGDSDKLKELTKNMGLVYYYNEDFNTKYEGLAYSNNPSQVLDENNKVKCPDVISIPEGGGYDYKDTNFKDLPYSVIKSNYTAKVRKTAKTLEPKIKEKYDKNPCDMVGVLKAFRVTRRVINIIKILVPLVLIILGSIELTKVVMSGDQNQINKSVKTLIGKVIIGILIFFIPTIVNLFVNLVPKKSQSSFYNCSACFFGDDDFSSRTCDQKIDGIQSLEKDAKEFYQNWKQVETTCARDYKSYVTKSCSHVPYASQQACMDNISISSYTVDCVCKNAEVTGYTKEAAEEKCEELYPKSKRDEGFQKVIDNYNRCMKNASSEDSNVIVTICRDDLKDYYANDSVIESLEKLAN